MTTVCWDGKIMAADSRSSQGALEASYNEKIEEIPSCVHCGGAAHLARHDSVKIIVNPKDTWLGESILVAGTSGRTTIGRAIRSALVKGEGLRDFVLKADRLNIHTPDRPPVCRLLMITNKTTRLVVFEGWKMTETVYPLNQPIAIGSGRSIAEFAMNILGLNAIEAVRAASTTDKATGGSVRYVDTTVAPNSAIKLITTDAETCDQTINRFKTSYAKVRKPKGPMSRSRTENKDE